MNRTYTAAQSAYGYMRQKEVLTLLPVGSATLWRWIKSGKFISPVKISDRVTAWKRSEVYAWLEQQGEQ